MKSNRFLLPTLACVAAWFLISDGQAQTSHGYKVIGSMEQPRANFVQGLQIVDDYLYVSTGKYGKSQLLRYKLSDGTLQHSRQLDAGLYGEGLTLLNDKIYQLTWKSRIAFVYNKENMKGYKWFRIAGEGWGITNNGKDLIYSDGSHRLYFLSADTLAPLHSIEVTEGGVKVEKLNELEWINGKIWANIWHSDRIVIIEPETGHVTASIDLSGLLPDNERRTDTNVLNGIAQNPADGSIWVTGKYWPKLFQIEVVPPLATVTPKEQSYEQ